MHYRTIANIFDLLAELGGVLDVIVFFFMIAVSPISKHNFMMDALNTLFLAKSKKEKIFKEQKQETGSVTPQVSEVYHVLETNS